MHDRIWRPQCGANLIGHARHSNNRRVHASRRNPNNRSPLQILADKLHQGLVIVDSVQQPREPNRQFFGMTLLDYCFLGNSTSLPLMNSRV